MPRERAGAFPRSHVDVRSERDGAMSEHSDLRLRLSERIATLALRRVTVAERDAFLREQDRQLRADGLAAGLSSEEAASAAGRVMAWARDMISLADPGACGEDAETAPERQMLSRKD